MLKGESALFLGLVEQTENHLRAANKSSFVIELRIVQYARHPRLNMRAPNKIFSCKPVLARMQRLAAGGAVTIGIVTYSSGGRQWENG